jgi:hypothetical protein
MVYDEGFDIIFNQGDSLKNDRSYFVFSKYGKNNSPSQSIKSKWVSYCYSTLIGWYYQGDQWGCIYGYKLGVNKDEITNGEAENKLNVVEGVVSRKEDSNSEEMYTSERYFMDDTNSKSEVIEADSIDSRSTPQKSNLKLPTAFLETKFKSDLSTNYEMLLASTLKYNEKLVETINSENLLWRAENYKEFSKMNFLELNKFAGRLKKVENLNKLPRDRLGSGDKKNPEMGGTSSKNLMRKKQSQIGIKDIPANFNWIDKMSEPRSQVNNHIK